MEFIQLAISFKVPIVLITPTWRSSLDWALKNGYTEGQLNDANTKCLKFLRDLVAETGVQAVVGCKVGPRYDGYKIDSIMSPDEAEAYHSKHISVFKAAGADFILA